jgi:hypothetical protein
MVMAINIVFRKLIIWPKCDKLQFVSMGFKNLCDMLSVMGVIDGTHLYNKTNLWFFKGLLLHKSGDYTIVA